MAANDPRRKFERLFTVDEANALIPQLVEWLTEIRKLYQKVRDVVESKQELARGNGRVIKRIEDLHDDLETVSGVTERIRELVEQVNGTGAEVKDIELCQVDFPHLRKGEVVYLCWMLGEDKIAYWHDLDAGVARRKPI